MRHAAVLVVLAATLEPVAPSEVAPVGAARVAPAPLLDDDRPPSIPADWVAWRKWPGCTFWLPGDAGAMPPPIEWEACPVEAGAAACRWLAAPWQGDDGSPIAPDVGFAVDAEGTPRLAMERLALGRGADSYVEWIVGGTDGAIEFAMRQPWPAAQPSCWALERDLSPERFAFSLHGDGTSTQSDVDGLLVGRIGAREPAIFLRDDERGTNDWSIGAAWVLRNAYGVVTAHGDDGKSVTIYEPSMNPDRSPFDGQAKIIGRDIVFQVGDYRTAAIWAYDASRGTHALIGGLRDGSRGATNVGTDGEDLVWTEGTGKPVGGEGLYSKVSIMTAPFTTDPQKLAPRRLRADMSAGIGTAQLQFAVGCGYAGRLLADGTDVQVVRLSDGAAWRVRGSEAWAWDRVLGFTCGEVFLTVHTRARGVGVARVPLASLGEPLAPD